MLFESISAKLHQLVSVTPLIIRLWPESALKLHLHQVSARLHLLLTKAYIFKWSGDIAIENTAPKYTTSGVSKNTPGVRNIVHPAPMECIGPAEAILVCCPTRLARDVTNCGDVAQSELFHGIRTKVGVDSRDHSQCSLIQGCVWASSASHVSRTYMLPAVLAHSTCTVKFDVAEVSNTSQLYGARQPLDAADTFFLVKNPLGRKQLFSPTNHDPNLPPLIQKTKHHKWAVSLPPQIQQKNHHTESAAANWNAANVVVCNLNDDSHMHKYLPNTKWIFENASVLVYVHPREIFTFNQSWWPRRVSKSTR